MDAPGKEGLFTYEDYFTWDDGTRWELFEGAAYAMVPGPSSGHQSLLVEFSSAFNRYLKGKPCAVFIAPYDVRLNPDTADDTVVQPDLAVICDKTKIDHRGCKGAPDFIIEILSATTARHDRVIKFNLYLKAGVKEYWIVDPDERTVQACILNNGRYYMSVYTDEDIAPVSVLPGLKINLQEIFKDAWRE